MVLSQEINRKVPVSVNENVKGITKPLRRRFAGCAGVADFPDQIPHFGGRTTALVRDVFNRGDIAFIDVYGLRAVCCFTLLNAGPADLDG
jgi:hypothetical protein